ncbi:MULTISPECIES: hypothetical protein [unclassified Brevibacterium]|uniref:hypothetical protein n=1 Tax=unclassified Brevibacterium TaxID=2614124 RepID=UPI000C420AEF|nr:MULTISPECIES: hypothetical protein [unclassified Brevibacterium]SMX93443.1 hypothetical protein BSP239C_02459 [Brevibacterium sp. 239c]
MTVDRTELAEALAEATGWSVMADARRVTFTNDDPPQVVIWTVTDAEIGELRYSQNRMAKSAGARQTADLGALWLPVYEALGPFEGSRGYMHGTELIIRE